ncbi:hypothetical protein SAMN06297144_1876 [Sphingomonas guangdongensis]|uniref:Phage tail tube protein n=1 Tax=Sphingomonas guangdongensis TaxID=1141890 RepID=A0A285R335_9SPHN|nr:phage tail tube protein [Sphingomonas guangdongensis]SOB86767.1 hypothetical protein SAMN06297144_1876 [Sphingomonas guangdongensis]
MAAINAKATTVHIKVGAAAPVKIGGIKDFDFGGGSAPDIDTSDLDSTKREFMTGLADEGEMTLTLNYLPTDAGQTAVSAARDANTRIQLIIANVPGNVKWEAYAYAKTFSISGGLDQAFSASASFKFDGAITKSATT